jgi:hypothetical protein
MTNKFTDNPVALPNMCYNSSPSAKTLADAYKAYAEGNEDTVSQRPYCDQGDVMSKQVGGNHYRKAIQPWDIIEEWQLGYFRGNVLKYILRAPYKNGKEDLEKAKHYLEYIIENYDRLKDQGL